MPFCVECGAKVCEGWKFCRECGTKLEEPPENQSSEEPVPKNLSTSPSQNTKNNMKSPVMTSSSAPKPTSTLPISNKKKPPPPPPPLSSTATDADTVSTEAESSSSPSQEATPSTRPAGKSAGQASKQFIVEENKVIKTTRVNSPTSNGLTLRAFQNPPPRPQRTNEEDVKSISPPTTLRNQKPPQLPNSSSKVTSPPTTRKESDTSSNTTTSDLTSRSISSPPAVPLRSKRPPLRSPFNNKPSTNDITSSESSSDETSLTQKPDSLPNPHSRFNNESSTKSASPVSAPRSLSSKKQFTEKTSQNSSDVEATASSSVNQPFNNSPPLENPSQTTSPVRKFFPLPLLRPPPFNRVAPLSGRDPPSSSSEDLPPPTDEPPAPTDDPPPPSEPPPPPPSSISFSPPLPILKNPPPVPIVGASASPQIRPTSPSSGPLPILGSGPLPLSGKRQATKDGEVVLVGSSYATPPPPPRVPALPPPPDNIEEIREANQQTMKDPKYRRVSFQTIVALTTGHTKGEAYDAHVVGFEKRTETLQGSKYVTVFKIDVTKGNLSWSVFRRHNQFAELDRKLKKKKLLPYSNTMLPSKRLGEEGGNEQLKNSLEKYLQFLLSLNEVATSPYIHNFLEPLQLGDIKPKPPSENVPLVRNELPTTTY